MSDIEYCKKCLDHTCSSHKWFTEKDPQTDKEIIILFLQHVSEHIGHVFEKVLLVEQVVNDWDDYLIDMGGILDFNFKCLPTVHKKDSEYIPVSSYPISDKTVLDFNITIKVSMMRHHPTEIWIQNPMTGEIFYVYPILDFMDNLHCESIEDYPAIVKLAQYNIVGLINKIINEGAGYIECDNCRGKEANMGSFQPSSTLFLTLKIDRPMNLCSECHESMQNNAEYVSTKLLNKDNKD